MAYGCLGPERCAPLIARGAWGFRFAPLVTDQKSFNEGDGQ